MTPEFRQAIFRWIYNPEKDGPKETCIPYQLQRLFGLLQLSKQRSVDTVALTHSFGWEGYEVFQQQDVQELTRVLFDALEETFRGTEFEHVIDDLYAGELVDYLRCIDVDYQTERKDKFLDFSLAIVPFGSNVAMHSLHECIEMFLRPEILDGDNQYFCESVGKKVDAIKGLKFNKLPKIMCVQLKRFVYDFSGATVIQKKLHDEVRFPFVLDMNRYVARKRLAHIGDEMDCDDQYVVNEEFETFLREQMERLRHGDGSDSKPNEIVTDDPDVPSLLDEEEKNSGENDKEAYDSLSSQEIAALVEEHGEWVYELYAVLIHSGSLHGGHYYAYIKDLTSGGWYNFNDSTVTPIDESTVRTTFGGYSNSSLGYSSPSYVSSYMRTSSSSAYMLLYRKVIIGGEKEVNAISEEIVPTYVRDLVREEEEAVLVKQREEEERRNRLNIKLTLPGGEERYLPAKRNDTLRSLMEDIYENFSHKMFANISQSNEENDTAATTAAAAAAVVVEDTKEIQPETQQGEDGEGGIPFHLFRLRDYNSYSKIAQSIYDYDSKGTRTLGDLGFADYRSYLVEVRSPNQCWEVYYLDGFSILVDIYDHSLGTMKPTVTIRLPKGSSLLSFKEALKRYMDLEVEDIRIIKMISVGYSDGRYEVIIGDDRKLREELGVYDNMKVYAEDGRSCAENESLAFQAFLFQRNRMELRCAGPNDPVSFDHNILADGRWTVARLRETVANYFHLPVERTRIFKQSVHGVELKDNSQILSYQDHVVGLLHLPSLEDEEEGEDAMLDHPPPLPPRPPSSPVDLPLSSSPISPLSSPPPPPVAIPYEGRETVSSTPVTTTTAAFVDNTALDMDAEIAAYYAQMEGEDEEQARNVPDLIDADLASDIGVVGEGDQNPSPNTTIDDSLLDQNDNEVMDVSTSSSRPLVLKDPVEVEPSDFADRVVRNAMNANQFEAVDEIEDLHVSNTTLVSDLRKMVWERLIKYHRLSPDFPLHRLRLRDRYHLNPGRILRDDLTLSTQQVYLVDRKLLAYEELPEIENLSQGSPPEEGDVVVLVQRWMRSTWSLGPRREVLLPGQNTVREIARGLGVLFDIPLGTMQVLVIPRDTEIPLYCLADHQPQRNYGRAWFPPAHEERLLRYMSHDMQVRDGDLLLLQDCSEPLCRLSEADLRSVAIVEAAASSDMNGFHGPLPESWSSSEGVQAGPLPLPWPYSGTGTHSQISTEGSGRKYSYNNGIKIKIRGRNQDNGESASSSGVPSQVGTPFGVLADENSGSRAMGQSPVDMAVQCDDGEFNRQGGVALFDDLI
eukprot:scaffold2815_cov180-Ochromonas_danica.AAC.4